MDTQLDCIEAKWRGIELEMLSPKVSTMHLGRALGLRSPHALHRTIEWTWVWANSPVMKREYISRMPFQCSHNTKGALGMWRLADEENAQAEVSCYHAWCFEAFPVQHERVWQSDEHLRCMQDSRCAVFRCYCMCTRVHLTVKVMTGLQATFIIQWKTARAIKMEDCTPASIHGSREASNITFDIPPASWMERRKSSELARWLCSAQECMIILVTCILNGAWIFCQALSDFLHSIHQASGMTNVIL